MALVLRKTGVAVLQIPAPVHGIDAAWAKGLAKPAAALGVTIACTGPAIGERDGPWEWEPRVDPVDDGLKHRSRSHY